MSPEAFVRLLAEDLKVSGVVVGENYRFGYALVLSHNRCLVLVRAL